MACVLPPLLEDSTEKANGTKLARLLIDGGTWALRHVLDSKHPGASFTTYLNSNKATLQAKLFPPRGKHVLNYEQWRMLYPPLPSVPNTADFDITLLFVLLRNTCGLVEPPTGWNNLPAPGDNSLEAQLATIKWYKNKVYSHINTTSISNAEFAQYWADISSALLFLGVSQNDIDQLKAAPFGEKEYVEVLREWKECDVAIADTFSELTAKIDLQSSELAKHVSDEVAKHVSDELAKQSSELAKHVSDELAKQSAELKEIKANIEHRRSDVDIHINCTNATTTSSEPVQNHDVLEGIMRDIVTMYNQTYSQDADKHALIQHLLNFGLIHVKSQETQSLCVTVRCPTLESLEALWNDYINGHLNEVAEKYLVTEDTLKKFDLSEVKLKTTISEEEYTNCLRHFLNLDGCRRKEDIKDPSVVTVVGSSQDSTAGIEIATTVMSPRHMITSSAIPNVDVGSVSTQPHPAISDLEKPRSSRHITSWDRGKATISRSSKRFGIPNVNIECVSMQPHSADVIVLEKMIGKGSYGEVRLARWKGVRVAAKRIPSIFFEKDYDQEIRENCIRKLRNEWEVLRNLDHPNIVKMLTALFPVNRSPIIVTELLDWDLECYIQKSETLPKVPLKECISLAFGIAKGLEYLHSLQPPVVHRDLSTKKILMSKQKCPKITGFGAAKVFTEGKDVFATPILGAIPRYAAPETYPTLSINVVKYGPKVDVFSYGVVVLAMIVGHESTAWRIDPLKVPKKISEIVLRERDIEEMGHHILRDVVLACLENSSEARPDAVHIVKQLEVRL